MKVTLKNILQKRGLPEDNLLQGKRELIKYKKEGKLFFVEKIASLDLDTPFELYYFQLPNDKSEVNAFPVPIESFQYHLSEYSSYQYMSEYFENYYRKSLDEAVFKKYDIQPYIGKEYVWYYYHSG